MEKRLIRNEKEVQNAIDFFGKEWEDEIKQEVKGFPSILISCYSDDIEFGEYYQFTSVKAVDIIKLQNLMDFCLN